MNRLHVRLLVAGAVLLLALLTIWLGSQLQRYEDVVEHGPAPQARSNDYLAAELFLRALGLQVARHDGIAGLETLPNSGQTLLLLGDRRNMTPRQTERLLDWAAAGGHLVVVAERLWDEKTGKSGDLLLDRLNLQQYSTRDLDEEAQSPQSSTAEQHPQLTKLYLENESAPAYLAFDTDFHLYDADNRAHAWANSAGATHMLQLQHGNGLVTALTDSWIWQNRNIDEYDHAWLLWYLTQDSEVTLVHRSEHDGLLAQLRKHFPETLTALGLLILFALWHVGQRFGPLLPAASPARRQLQEHLRGSAEFLLRHGREQSLLQRLQQDIQRRANVRHPGFEQLPLSGQLTLLAQLSSLPPASIEQAMRPTPQQRLSATEFTRQVAYLQTLRNAL
ncbi:DUF4350 domain-containing protein [Pseudomonas songnenensis]|uniref:DUF4350 domain-containing protein n=1 Tax=Pseudomonas songnenensis TaxID=1176259 RepID=A0ABX9US20_9PSED|nr:DUF4350 domain-containing protein [Pseudomonas songnenensis]MCQ4300093.1 DUF4350 domain-containing protein [Pseudomonas songnenensis]RMH95754.1 DUF4350 domain-containing protein [Pseudomonas songnenensis]